MLQVLHQRSRRSAIGDQPSRQPIADSDLSPEQTRDFGRNIRPKHIAPGNGEHSGVGPAISGISGAAIAAVGAVGAFGSRLAGVAVAVVPGRTTGAAGATLTALAPLAAVTGRTT